ncbi:MAG: hypothetical protein IPK27_10005 [Rhodanobacteraceae bacterium]|nr:hypothetical protein [Rhodanobacteraceae bacterium]
MKNALVQSQSEQLASANARLTGLAHDLEQASRTKSQFLANMSHEIRTPMNAVLGMATLLAKTPLQARQQGLLGRLTASARMLLGIINDILDLSRIEAGKMRIEQAPFRLDDALTDAVAVVGERARAKGIELLFAIAPEVPKWLVGDSMRLRQVPINLTGNALKFTERGQVLVEIDCSDTPGETALLRFAVTDSGIGIAPADLERLFQPFSQVDESDARVHGGAGAQRAGSRHSRCRAGLRGTRAGAGEQQRECAWQVPRAARREQRRTAIIAGGCRQAHRRPAVRAGRGLAGGIDGQADPG